MTETVITSNNYFSYSCDLMRRICSIWDLCVTRSGKRDSHTPILCSADAPALPAI